MQPPPDSPTFRLALGDTTSNILNGQHPPVTQPANKHKCNKASSNVPSASISTSPSNFPSAWVDLPAVPDVGPSIALNTTDTGPTFHPAFTHTSGYPSHFGPYTRRRNQISYLTVRSYSRNDRARKISLILGVNFACMFPSFITLKFFDTHMGRFQWWQMDNMAQCWWPDDCNPVIISMTNMKKSGEMSCYWNSLRVGKS